MSANDTVQALVANAQRMGAIREHAGILHFMSKQETNAQNHELNMYIYELLKYLESRREANYGITNELDA